jgi:hypothetical protein
LISFSFCLGALQPLTLLNLFGNGHALLGLVDRALVVLCAVR